MFTGLIKGIGAVTEKKITATEVNLKIETDLSRELQLGDSMAVNGVCLTASRMGPTWFQADIMPETWKATNLKGLKPGDLVNLEPALALGERLGGHLVSGHVDGVGQITSIQKQSNAWIIRLSFPQELRKFLAPKGSVALNGVSLTIQDIGEQGLMVSLIPHTAQMSIFGRAKIEDQVNIEVDLLARYVANLMEEPEGKKELTNDFLNKHGFS